MTRVATGCAFLITSDAKPHLWIVLTDPDDTGHVVAVMVVTKRIHSDTTVVLQAGDHSFIKHESTIRYADAVRIDLNTLNRWLKLGRCLVRDDVSQELLMRVRQGLYESEHTGNGMKEFCRRHF